MRVGKRTITMIAGTVAVVALLASCGKKEEADAAMKAEQVAAEARTKVDAAAKEAEALAKEAEALALSVEAYVYGYPLVTMEMTRRVMTNVDEPEGTRAPMGQFVRMREYPERDVPRRHRAERRHALHHRLVRRRRRSRGSSACPT